MEDRNSYSYIIIGLALRLLMNLKDTYTKKSVETELNNLKNALRKVEFSVSCSNIETSFFTEMESELEKLEDDDPIGEDLCLTFNKEMLVLERHVLSEGLIKQVHIFPERRFNSNYLLNKQEKLFRDGVFEKLPELAQLDIRSSCRCLLFGEATAAAFHILRATEDVLKQYYFHHIKQSRLKKPMWGPIIEKLRAKTRNKPSKTLLDSLDLIRDAYRNPTQHPYATYDIDSAQDLFGVCADAIGKMADEL